MCPSINILKMFSNMKPARLDHMSVNDLTMLFTVFLSVDGSHHSEFHEATRGETERVTVKPELHKMLWCSVL